MEAATLWERVAVIVWLDRAAGANARQISAVPLCVLARATSVHVMPPPATALTLVFAPERQSVAIKASNSSLPALVEIAGLTIVLLAVALSLNTAASWATLALTAVAVKLTPVTLPPLITTL